MRRRSGRPAVQGYDLISNYFRIGTDEVRFIGQHAVMRSQLRMQVCFLSRLWQFLHTQIGAVAIV